MRGYYLRSIFPFRRDMWHVSSRTVPVILPSCQNSVVSAYSVSNISSWIGASWKIIEWNVPPGFGFGNPKYCCLEVQGYFYWAMVVSRLLIPAMQFSHGPGNEGQISFPNDSRMKRALFSYFLPVICCINYDAVITNRIKVSVKW